MVSRTVDGRSPSAWLLPLVVGLATAATLVVNYLANALPINGQTTNADKFASSVPPPSKRESAKTPATLGNTDSTAMTGNEVPAKTSET